MAGGRAWQGSMGGRGCVCGGGCAWQGGGMCGGRAWQEGACVAGGICATHAPSVDTTATAFGQ